MGYLGIPVKAINYVSLAENVVRSVSDRLLTLRQNSLPFILNAIEVLDDASNEMCSVADSMQCIEALHPDIHVKASARKALVVMNKFMNGLNADEELRDVSIL